MLLFPYTTLILLAFIQLSQSILSPHLPLKCKTALLESYSSLESCGILESSLLPTLEKKCSQSCKQTIMTLNKTLSLACEEAYIYTQPFIQSSLLNQTINPHQSDSLTRLIGNMTLSELTHAYLTLLPITCLKIGNQYCTKDQAKSQFQKQVFLEKFEELGEWVNWIPGFQSESIIACNLCTEKKSFMVKEVYEKEGFMERWEESIYRFEEAVGKCRIEIDVSSGNGKSVYFVGMIQILFIVFVIY